MFSTAVHHTLFTWASSLSFIPGPWFGTPHQPLRVIDRLASEDMIAQRAFWQRELWALVCGRTPKSGQVSMPTLGAVAGGRWAGLGKTGRKNQGLAGSHQGHLPDSRCFSHVRQPDGLTDKSLFREAPEPLKHQSYCASQRVGTGEVRWM